MIKCNSCGAAFDNKEPKCPYCGTLNVEGAQKEYNKKLNHIRKKLDVVDDEARNDYKSAVGAFFKAFSVTIGIALLVALVMVALYKTAETAENNKKVAENAATIQQMAALHGQINIMNSYYDEGKYDELCDLYESLEDKDNRHLLRQWKHYDFEEAYYDYLKVLEDIEKAFNEGERYEFSSALQEACVFKYNNLDKDSYYSGLTEKDKEILFEKFEIILTQLQEKLSVSKSEFDEVYKAATIEGYPSYSAISDYAKERFGE